MSVAAVKAEPHEAVAMAQAKGERISLVQSVSAADFVRGFEAFDYLLEPLIQPGYVYALTGKTGHAKTAVTTRLELAIVSGTSIAGHDTKKGKVLSLCGENPSDKQARILASCQALKITPPDTLRLIGGSFPIGERLAEIKADAEQHGPYSLVTVDTSAAFFYGGDENDNVQVRLHASELRELATIAGKPAVLVLCHPTKAATSDNLQPRGGGAFLNDIDGNLTCWLNGDVITVHWQGKIRGPGFEPIQFKLRKRAIDGLLNSKGKPVESVVAMPIDDAEAEQLARAELHDENRLLDAMLQYKAGSIADWARNCGWTTPKGEPHKSKVFRMLESLQAEKLAKKSRGRWCLTAAGTAEAEKVLPR